MTDSAATRPPDAALRAARVIAVSSARLPSAPLTTKGPTTRHYQSYVTRNPSKPACHEGLTPPQADVLTTPLLLPSAVVRDQIKEFASTRIMFSSAPKMIILDEADNMTSAAQSALRRVIEKYTKNARFCLICNYASKIIPALQSRCTRFRFAPLGREQCLERVRVVADTEQVKYVESGLEACVRFEP